MKLSMLLLVMSLTLAGCAGIQLTDLPASPSTPTRGDSLLWLAYDASMLQPALELAQTQRVTVVLNPDDGPGAAKDKAFSRFIAEAVKTRNLSVVGYVDLVTWGSSWKAKTVQQLTKERDTWHDLYGVTSFWLDDCFPDQKAFKELVVPFQSAASSSFLNAGENVPNGHWLRESGFIVCDFEDPTSAKTWAKAVGPCMILFTTGDRWRSEVASARAKGARFVGIEDINKHHAGEFQKPFRFWGDLK